jgi:hypothetical protein
MDTEMQTETIEVPKVPTREMLLAGAKHIARVSETDDDAETGSKDEYHRALGCAAAVWMDMIAALPPNNQI